MKKQDLDTYSGTMKFSTFVVAVFAALLFASCDRRNGMQPRSGGRPFEVTVVGDVDSLVFKAMSVDVDGLPQSEPMFDVSEASVSPQNVFDGVLRYARALVIVDIDPKKHDGVSLAARHDVYATPQIILTLCAPSVSALREEVGNDFLGGFSGKIIDRLYYQEMRTAIADIRRKHNPKMEAEVRRMFGFDMLIPHGMTSCKRGKNFIWISNNSPTAMLNICVYSHDFSRRDSVMRLNIKGETDSMYMATVRDACSATYSCKYTFAEHYWRGLWEMKGDAMGGPLVARTIWGLNPHTPITVEGFVYAPGQRKRNLVMLLDAVLHTVK